MKASYYITEGEKLRCKLCPHECLLKNGQTGLCGVRKHSDGVLISEVYGIISAMAVDPVEKKPLYHFFPGKKILSVGSYGCNMTCHFCQNYNISQVSTDITKLEKQILTPESVIEKASQINNNIGIAFTYNEPIVWFEYMKDIAVLAKSHNQHTVMVSNGFVNKEPLKEIIDFIDAFNIDLKSFNNSFYKKYTGAGIKAVLETLEEIRKADRHLEITYLLIPGLNDSIAEFSDCIKWISDNLGKSTVLHLSRYFPNYRLSTSPTPVSDLKQFALKAKESLDYVYIGNVHAEKGSDTYCPSCGSLLTDRMGYHIKHVGLSKEGKCSKCATQIYHFF